MSDTTTPAAESTNEPQGSATGEQQTPASGTETPTVEDLLAKVEEITGHSRKWEDRAKANKEKAEQADALASEIETLTGKITEAETARDEAVKRAEEAEATVARLTVAMEFGLSADDAKALASVSDETALRALAERLAAATPRGPRPIPEQGRRSDKPAPSTAKDAFVDVFEALG
jgi:vacuolar-type H+-ATPase subunit I/STV1